MTITVPSNYQPHMDTAQVLVEQLKAIGVNATIQPVEWASWLSDVYTGRRYQATVVGVDASNMTARALLERFTSTRPRPTMPSRLRCTSRWRPVWPKTLPMCTSRTWPTWLPCAAIWMG